MPPAALIGVAIASTVASTATSVIGGRKGGRQQQEAAYLEAAQLEQQAGQTRAVGQRQAQQISEQARRLAGRQRALQSSSGFAADDVSALAVTKETTRVATMDQLLKLAESEDQARGLEFDARQTRLSGDRARSAANRASIGTLLGGVGSIAAQGAALRTSLQKPPPKPGAA